MAVGAEQRSTRPILRGLQAEVAEQGLTVSRWTVWRLFTTENITPKKASCHRSKTTPTLPGDVSVGVPLTAQ